MTSKARIVRPAEVEIRIPPAEAAARWVGGEPADGRRVSEALGTDELKINVLFFEPGVRSRPHTHSHDQVLYYISGRGVVALDGGDDQVVQAGEFVLLPANVPHMHGAAADGPASHISLMRETDMDFDCPIPDSWARWRQ
jgi:quercetin dioxygenase-like cupin family protein